MITGRPPFTAANHVALLKKIRATKEISFPIAENQATVAQGSSTPPSSAQAFDTIAYAYASSIASPHRSTGASFMQSWDMNRVSVEILDLTRALLTVNPVERMSFEEFFLHPAVRNSAPSVEKLSDGVLNVAMTMDSNPRNVVNMDRSAAMSMDPRAVDGSIYGVSVDSKRSTEPNRSHDASRNIPPQFVIRPRSHTMPETLIPTTKPPVDVSADNSFDLERAMGSMIIGIPTVTSAIKQPDVTPGSSGPESASLFPPHPQDDATFAPHHDGHRYGSIAQDGFISSSQPTSPFSAKSPSPFPSLPQQSAGAFARHRPVTFSSTGDESYDHPFPMDEHIRVPFPINEPIRVPSPMDEHLRERGLSLEKRSYFQDTIEEHGDIRVKRPDRHAATLVNSPDHGSMARRDSGLSPSSQPPATTYISMEAARQQQPSTSASLQHALGHSIGRRLEAVRMSEGSARAIIEGTSRDIGRFNDGMNEVGYPRMGEVGSRLNEAITPVDNSSSSPVDIIAPKWNEWLQPNQASLPFAQQSAAPSHINQLRQTPPTTAQILLIPIHTSPPPVAQALFSPIRQTLPTSRESQVAELVRRQSRIPPVDGDVEDDGFVIL